MKINNKVPGLGLNVTPTRLDLSYKDDLKVAQLPDAYERLLLDVVNGAILWVPKQQPRCHALRCPQLLGTDLRTVPFRSGVHGFTRYHHATGRCINTRPYAACAVSVSKCSLILL